MKKCPLTLTLLLGVLVPLACWLAVAGVPADYWGWRRMVVMVSGVGLAALIGACALLAVRPGWLERSLGGLDKLYALHKRFGIACALMLGVHWLADLSPKLFLALEWAAPKVRKAGGVKDPLMSLAKDMGEWAAWGMLAMVVVALLSAIPYRWWRPSHRLFAPLVLMGAWHGLMLFDARLWAGPAGVLFAAILAVSVYAALMSLFGRIGRKRRHAGQIVSLERLPGGTLDILCKADGWPGHAAGQFALVTFDKREGAHPFTIASAPRPGGELRFIVKALGDYTATLADTLHAGDALLVEGPYGGFVAGQGRGRQAWVAGGIGVTPFLAWLEARGRTGGTGEVDFYYCVKDAGDAAALEEVRERARASGVCLHLVESVQGGRFDPAGLSGASDVYFCGPPRLGEAIEAALRARGRAAHFHHEAFAMR